MAEANNPSSLCGSSTSSELSQLTAVLKMNGSLKENENNCDVPRSPLSGNCLLSSVSHNCNTAPGSSSGTSLNSSDSRCLPVEKFILNKARNPSNARISSIELSDRALAITSMSNDALNTAVSVNSKKLALSSNLGVEKNESQMSSKFTVASVLRNVTPDHQGSASSMQNVQDDGACSRQYVDMTSQCSQRVQCDGCNALYSNDVHFSEQASKCCSHAVGTEDRVFQNVFHNVCVPSTSGGEVDAISMLNSDCRILCNSKLIAPCGSSRFLTNTLDQTHVPGFSLDSSHDESVPSGQVPPDCSKCVSNHNKRVQFTRKNFATAWESIPEMCKCFNSKLDSSLPHCQQMHNRNASKHCRCDDLCSARIELINNPSGSEGLDAHHANTEYFYSHTVGSSRDAHDFHICMGIKAPISDKEIPSVSSSSSKSFLSSEQNFESVHAYSVSESNGFYNHNCQRVVSEHTISATGSPTILHHLQSPGSELDELFHQKKGHCLGPDISYEMHETNACSHVSTSLTNGTSLDESSEFQCGHHHEHLAGASKSILCKGSDTFAQFSRSTNVSQPHPVIYNDDWQATRCTACLNCKFERRELCCSSGNHSYDRDKCRDFCSPCHVTFSSTRNKLSDASTQIAFPKPTCNKFASHTSAMDPVRETFRTTSALANLPSNHSLKKKVIQKLNRHKFRSPFKESASTTYQRKTRSASFWMTCVSLANKAGIPRPVLSASKSSWEGNSLSSPCPISSVPRPDILIQGLDQPNLMPSKDSSSKVDECLVKKDAVSSLPEDFPVSELQRKLLYRGASNMNDTSNLTEFKAHSCSGNESSCSSNKFSDKLQLTKECSSMLELKMLLEKSLQLGSTCPTLHPQKCLPEHGTNKDLNDESNVPVQAVHTQVDYIHCLVPDLLAITGCSFYWGKMDRYEAENLLNNRPEGTFLLRDSAQTDYLFSVSFRRYGKSLHARVEQGNHKFSFDSHDPDVFASDTVSGLIQHYKDPSCCMFFEPMLTIPLCRSFPFPLQHLCRATICSSTTYDGINKLKLPKVLRNYLKEYHYKQLVRIRRFDQ